MKQFIYLARSISILSIIVTIALPAFSNSDISSKDSDYYSKRFLQHDESQHLNSCGLSKNNNFYQSNNTEYLPLDIYISMHEEAITDLNH